ncbi:MAG: FkbM family methyltransferase [Verrucomicrobiales bacterium]|nr:FkbM family methyltransferase [Verrucomicrobiales bacterium]
METSRLPRSPRRPYRPRLRKRGSDTMYRRLKAFAVGLRQWAGSTISGDPARQAFARRQLHWRSLGLFQRETTFQRNGFTWTGSTSCSITELIFTTDHYQDARLEEVTSWLAAQGRFTRPVLVNVGANLGDLVLPLSRTGKRILAVEPNPETFARLVRNVRQNGLQDRITCCDVAISDASGTARLVSAGDPGNSELESGGARLGFDGQDYTRAVHEVKTLPLTDLLASQGIAPGDVALVVSDTQGFETRVIESGAALWRGKTPLWVEIWPKGLACHGGVEAFLRSCERHFTHFIPETGIGAPPEPVRNLSTLVGRLKNAEFTDVLLIS